MQRPTSPARSLALSPLVSLALTLAACVTPQPLVTPAPFVAAGTPQETREAIVRALSEGGWGLESERPGAIFARFSQDDWSMFVEIAYANEVSIRYVGSVNLRYGIGKDGRPVIHRSYNYRVERLAKVIRTEILIARGSVSPPPVASPTSGEITPD
jgi:hypothetical protein